jgi:hypothetical protein
MSAGLNSWAIAIVFTCNCRWRLEPNSKRRTTKDEFLFFLFFGIPLHLEINHDSIFHYSSSPRAPSSSLQAARSMARAYFPLLTLVLGSSGCSASLHSSESEAIPLRPNPLEPAMINVGRLDRSEPRRQVSIVLRNATRRHIHISKVQSSCDCVTLEIGAKTIAPGETAKANVHIDNSTDPEFSGSLAVNVKAFDPDNVVVLELRVDLTITK